MWVRVVVVSLGFLEVRVVSDDDSTAIVVIVASAGTGDGSQSGVP